MDRTIASGRSAVGAARPPPHRGQITRGPGVAAAGENFQPRCGSCRAAQLAHQLRVAVRGLVVMPHHDSTGASCGSLSQHARTAHGLFDRHVAFGAQVGAASEPMVDARRVEQVPTWQSAHALFACKWLEADTACLRAHSVAARALGGGRGGRGRSLARHRRTRLRCRRRRCTSYGRYEASSSVGCRNDPAWAELVEALPAESLGLDG